MTLVWYQARIKDGKLWDALPKDSKVLVAKSDERLKVGTTWWVFDGHSLKQIAESAGGRGLHQAVKLVAPYHDSEGATQRFMPFYKKYSKAKRWNST